MASSLLAVAAALICATPARGQACFKAPVLPINGTGITAFDLGDMDGDGRDDVIQSTQFLGLRWLEADAGWAAHSIAVGGGHKSVIAFDIDNDSGVDVLATHDAGVLYHRYPLFAQTQIGPYTFPQTAELVDLNGNGYRDVVIGLLNGVVWHDNQGPLGISGPSSGVIDSGPKCTSIFGARIDSDTANDLVLARVIAITVIISWAKNSTWSRTDVATLGTPSDPETAAYVWAADLDDDGDNDIVAGGKDTGKIVWCENFGGAFPFFGPAVTVTTLAQGLSDLRCHDVDADGDQDVVASSSLTGSVLWFENDGAANPFFTEHALPATVPGVIDARLSKVTPQAPRSDFFVGAPAGPSGGGVRRFDRNPVILMGTEFSSIQAAALVAAPGSTLLCTPEHFEDDCGPVIDALGKPLVFQCTTAAGSIVRGISTRTTLWGGELRTIGGGNIDLSGIIEIKPNTTVTLGDNNFGDAVIGGALTMGANSVLRTTGDLNLVGRADFAPQPFALPSVGPGESIIDLAADDWDGDTTPDVHVLTDLGRIIRYEFDGDGSFDTEVWAAVGATQMDVADLDQDGDSDFILCGNTGTSWLRTDDISPGQSTLVPIGPAMVSVQSADLDGDDDADILCVLRTGTDTLNWFASSGGPAPTFSGPTAIETDTSGGTVSSMDVADVDGDGDLDVIVARPSRRYWLENEGGATPSFIARGASGAQRPLCGPACLCAGGRCAGVW